MCLPLFHFSYIVTAAQIFVNKKAGNPAFLMFDRRDDFLDSRVAYLSERFEVHCRQVHFIEDNLPVVGPEFNKHSVEQLESVSGIHDGLPVFLADLRVLFSDVLIGKVFVDDRVFSGMFDRPVLDLPVGGAKIFLLPKEILSEHLGPSAASVLIDEIIVLDNDPLPKSGGAQERARLLKLFHHLIRSRVLHLAHERNDMALWATLEQFDVL